MTTPQSHATPALVIGSGFGGLAAAIRLQARGYDTTILEMRDKPGGRAYVFEDKGFTYDAGPTIITAPFLIDELFAVAGRRAEDYVKIVPVTPYYRIIFHDGQVFDYTGNEAEIIEQIRKFDPDDIPGYLKFVEKSRERGEWIAPRISCPAFRAFGLAIVADEPVRVHREVGGYRQVAAGRRR